METIVQWNDSEQVMPMRYKYVLVETLYCKYPFCAAFYNGVDWISADDGVVLNVQFWAYVQTPAKAHGDGR